MRNNCQYSTTHCRNIQLLLKTRRASVDSNWKSLGVANQQKLFNFLHFWFSFFIYFLRKGIELTLLLSNNFYRRWKSWKMTGMMQKCIISWHDQTWKSWKNHFILPYKKNSQRSCYNFHGTILWPVYDFHCTIELNELFFDFFVTINVSLWIPCFLAKKFDQAIFMFLFSWFRGTQRSWKLFKIFH